MELGEMEGGRAEEKRGLINSIALVSSAAAVPEGGR